MEFLILVSLFLTSGFAAALPVDNALASPSSTGLTPIAIYEVLMSSEDIVWGPDNGTYFNPNPSAASIDRVCISNNIPACAFGATDGAWVVAYSNTSNGCVNVSPPLVLNNGFCCVSLDDCTALDSPFVLDARSTAKPHPHSSLPGILQSRDTVVNTNSLAILYEGAPDISSWERVITNFESFNVTDHVAWSIGQICINSTTALCAFVALDGSRHVVIGGKDSNCAVVGPPQVLVDGVCCNSWHECNTATQETINEVVGPAVLASIAGVSSTNATNFASNSSIASRQIDGMTIQYFGTGGTYEFQLVNGDYELFPTPPWSVISVCVITPGGYCIFDNVTSIMGDQVASGTCQHISPPQVLGAGRCCRLADISAAGCRYPFKALPDRSIEPISVRNTSDVNSAASLPVFITFYGDPAYYPETKGVTTYLATAADAHLQKLATFGQPVVQVCIDTKTSCQFYLEDGAVGPSFYGATGGCQNFLPSLYLGAVQCIDSPFEAPISIRDIADVDSAAATTTKVTFYGDPAVYTEAGGVITSIRFLADGHVQDLLAFGQPVIGVCVNTKVSCQFYTATGLGPSFYGATGGCQDVEPSEFLVSVQCIDGAFDAPLSVRDTTTDFSSAALPSAELNF